MPSVPYIVHLREKHRLRSRQNPSGKIGLSFTTILSLLTVFALLILAFGYTQLIKDLPSPDNLRVLLDSPDGILLQPTRLYDKTGEHVILALENPAGSGRQVVSLTPTHPLVKATLASVDPSFWSNPGFSMEGIQQGSHPTLAQHLVSDLLLWKEEPGLWRNLRERLLAAQITARFGRIKILEWYLSSTKYGPWIYGADAAARVYFNKNAADLNLAEATLLTAIAEAPDLNPFDAPQNISFDRQQKVIQSMVDYGFITPEEALQLSQPKVSLRKKSEPAFNLAPSFASMVMDQLISFIGKDRLERGGLQIFTTLDYDLQIEAVCTTAIQLQRMQSMKDASTQENANCQAARLLPSFPMQTSPYTDTLRAGAIVLDPHNGHILAMVGEPSHDSGIALNTKHPAGSLLTPFIYLTAFTRGLNPASLVWDIPSSLPLTLDNKALLEGPYHGPVRLRTAFVNDYLIPSIQILGMLGPENVEKTAQQLGLVSLTVSDLETNLHRLPLLSEGQITLLEATRAYAVYANQGTQVGQVSTSVSQSETLQNLNPLVILKVETTRGEVWMDCSSAMFNCVTQVRPVISPQLTYLITNILSDEIARWPSLGHPNPLEIGRPAGVKTGVSNDGNNGWTIGYTQQIVTGVWIGRVEGTPKPKQALDLSTHGAAGLWHAITQYANRNLPADNWSIPPGVITIEVCDPSGMLPTDICPTTINEVFLSGSEPTQTDTLYRIFQVNRETGRLATVFTPPELVEDRVYMVLPPEAAEWAKLAKLPTPPDSYDVIYAAPPPVTGAVITSPEMFAHVKGVVLLSGSASGNGFAFFRMQVGKGLYPREWIQLGKDNSNPIENETLTQWDTTGLNGLYAIQLQVVRKDQRVDTTTLQVTVDNQPPVVAIVSPSDGEKITSPKFDTVIFQANASDDQGLEKVEFYLDNHVIATLNQAPFTISWKAQPGEHRFLVKAYDLAGNVSEATVIFKIGN